MSECLKTQRVQSALQLLCVPSIRLATVFADTEANSHLRVVPVRQFRLVSGANPSRDQVVTDALGYETEVGHVMASCAERVSCLKVSR